MTEMTTIEVSKDLRDSVMRSARAAGLTVAEFLELAIHEHARRKRFEAVRRAYADAGSDRDYVAITDTWEDAASRDFLGLP